MGSGQWAVGSGLENWRVRWLENWSICMFIDVYVYVYVYIVWEKLCGCGRGWRVYVSACVCMWVGKEGREGMFEEECWITS